MRPSRRRPFLAESSKLRIAVEAAARTIEGGAISQGGDMSMPIFGLAYAVDGLAIAGGAHEQRAIQKKCMGDDGTGCQ